MIVLVVVMMKTEMRNVEIILVLRDVTNRYRYIIETRDSDSGRSFHDYEMCVYSYQQHVRISERRW